MNFNHIQSDHRKLLTPLGGLKCIAWYRIMHGFCMHRESGGYLTKSSQPADLRYLSMLSLVALPG